MQNSVWQGGAERSHQDLPNSATMRVSEALVELTSNPLALLFQAMGIKPIQAPKLDL